jgi:23S rRNA pseudouridine955/2504/2580 synthase
MFLHAHRLVFTHPASGEQVVVHAALPQECKRLLHELQPGAADRN